MKNIELSKILLQRKNLIEIKPKNITYEQDNVEKSLIVSILKNIQSLGFTFSKELFEKLSHLDKSEIISFYRFIIPELKILVGDDVEYKPMYPNFPKQIMEVSEAELFINAKIHYWSFGTLLPKYEENERLPLIDDNKMTVLSLGSHQDLMDIFTNLVNSKTSISQQDKEDIETIITSCSDYEKYLPDEIPLKENVAYVCKLIIEKAPIKNASSISKYFKTATDVLRLITALSGGDISLSEKTMYKHLKRPERRMIMDLLSDCNNIVEDMFRYKFEWVRIGEIIHPSEYWYIKKYNSVRNAFYILRNKKKPLFFAGKVQKAILENDMETAANILQNRPGDFARQLDKLIREAKNPSRIIKAFKQVAKEVSNPVLLQVRQHFIGRMTDNEPVRVFFPKGNLAKAMVVPNDLPKISDEVCKSISKICLNALVEKYAEKEPMGNVYVDDELKNYLVPFNQRSASKAVKTIVRGSQIPIKENSNTIRGFIWWTNTEHSIVDIDLSAVIYDKNWDYVEHISYTNLRSSKYRAYHSGDIVNGGDINGKGVAEFIDIEIDEVTKNTGRYVVFQVYSFSGQRFSTLPNCRFGWMEREYVGSGEIFEPSTVEMKIDLTSNSTVAIPVIFDCVERKFIWCDMDLQNTHKHYGGNNLESNLRGVTATCYGIEHLNKPNIYDLVMMNVMARGHRVNDRNKADIIFSNNKTKPIEVKYEVDKVLGIMKPTIVEKSEVPIITSFDTDYFMGQLL